MINVHLNGEVVRCPDIAEIKRRAAERHEAAGRCCFGVRECECATRNEYHLTYNLSNVKCDCNSTTCRDYKSYYDSDGRLWRKYRCPNMQRQYVNSLKSKSFYISTDTYRQMSSAAHDLIRSSQYKTLFLVLSFPKFINKPITEKDANKCFSKFVENLRENYQAVGYVAVRENGETNNRLHFHIVVSMPYHSFVDLNNAWCHAIRDYCHYSPCALRSKKDSLYIKSPVQAIKYVCKYFSKSRFTRSKTRIVFISNNLIRKPVPVVGSVNKILDGYKGIYINQTSDYSTCFRITNDKELFRFFYNFIYPTFENHYKISLFSKKMPDFVVPAPDF